MAKINTLNYQTVASWNGSEDLFIVEQPDGTKVATPAMVKQFIEAGDFVATGEVKDGHGNILDDIADQVSQLNDEIDTKQDTLTIVDISNQATIDTTKVMEFNAYTYGALIYIHLKLKPGVTDQTNVVSNLPYSVKGGYGVLPMFWMNAADAASNGVCTYAGRSIQYRGSTTTGVNGTQYSGMFFIE